MRVVKRGGALLGAALALGLGTAGQASAQPGPVHRFEALIEGRSRLIVRRNSVQWFHLDGVAPGREGGRNEPTVVNGIPWLPNWPDVPDAENRDCGCLSDVFTGLNPPPLTQPTPIPRIVRGRAVTRVVQIPHPTNDFTLALDLDDTSVGGADTYVVEIDLIPQHDFASFVAEATVRLDLNNAVGQGQVPPINDMDLRATFTLADASEGIDPVRDPVTILAGGSTASTILPGSFRRTSPGRFDFQGDVLGFFWRVTLIQRGPRTFELIAGVSGTTFSGAAVPLIVLVVVGNDRGSSVLAEGEMTTRTQQLALGPSTARAASAQPGPVFRFEALIEGKSRLIVRGNTVQWLHLEGVAPGREGGRNEPTLANGVPWLPSWPDVPDAENRDCGCLSNVFTGLNPPLPLMALNPTLRFVRARDDIFFVQVPHPSNNFTLTLDFDDTRSPGADTYIVELDLTPQHDFAAFPAEATVRFGLQNDADQGQVPPINDIDLRATFTLASDSEGIDPVREPVMIGLGVFRVFIPAGSFRRTSPGRFDFQGEVFGVALRVTIIQRGPSTFEFTAGISGGTVNGSGLPLTLNVSVGNDRGFNDLFEGEMTARTPEP